jgi:hypothetical protein
MLHVPHCEQRLRDAGFELTVICDFHKSPQLLMSFGTLSLAALVRQKSSGLVRRDTTITGEDQYGSFASMTSVSVLPIVKLCSSPNLTSVVPMLYIWVSKGAVPYWNGHALT